MRFTAQAHGFSGRQNAKIAKPLIFRSQVPARPNLLLATRCFCAASSVRMFLEIPGTGFRQGPRPDVGRSTHDLERFSGPGLGAWGRLTHLGPRQPVRSVLCNFARKRWLVRRFNPAVAPFLWDGILGQQTKGRMGRTFRSPKKKSTGASHPRPGNCLDRHREQRYTVHCKLTEKKQAVYCPFFRDETDRRRTRQSAGPCLF